MKFFGEAVVFCARACYNRNMKMQMKMLLLAAALLFAGGAFSLGAKTASAASATGELFLPTSYEQYLALEQPSDAAMNDSYVVIADGSGLYIYDREEVLWKRYLHAPFNGEPRTVTKVGFTSDGRLFFSDQDMHLFLYNFTTGEAQIQSEIPCSTFLIDGDTLYTAAVANGRTTFLAFPHRGAGLSYERRRSVGSLDASTSIAPHMFVTEGALHCAVNSFVYAFKENGSSYEASVKQLAGETVVQDLTSVAVYNDKIYYTVNGPEENGADGLYVATLNDRSDRLLEGDGFNALSVYDGRLFCVKGKSVREIETDGATARYTGYEIAAESDSPNRLCGAGDSARARDLIVTADCGNARVSVYNTVSKEYDILETGVANCVATDGNVIAAGVGASVMLYRKGESKPYYIHTTANAVTGVAVVFGKCYYVTEHHYGIAEEGAVEFTRSNSPTALASDVYGNLYVADWQYRVSRYTEEEFLDPTVEIGELVTEGWSLPVGYRCLRADFDGNLYYLHENAVYANGERLATVEANQCVYNANRAIPVSFALGFEDNGLYLQYGSYMVLEKNVSFPTLSSVAAGNVSEEVFSVPDRERLALSDVREGATGIGVDVGKLQEGPAHFPYTDYYRTGGGRGILLAERGKFSLVALYENYGYTTALYRTEDCSPAPFLWTDVPPSPRYATSEIALGYYPCLAGPLTVRRLPRASELTLLAIITSDGQFDFAYVSNGAETGFLPLSYLTETPPLPSSPDRFTLGYLKANEDGVLFRSASGQTLLVSDERQVKIYEGQNGLYFVRFEKDGVEYTAQVTGKMLRTGDPDALRMSLIIVLSVVAVGVAVCYVLFRPKRKKD